MIEFVYPLILPVPPNAPLITTACPVTNVVEVHENCPPVPVITTVLNVPVCKLALPVTIAPLISESIYIALLPLTLPTTVAVALVVFAK